MNGWVEDNGVLSTGYRLIRDDRILAMAWQIRGSVFWKLGIFGSTRQAETLDDAMNAAEAAIARGDKL
ncbi:hypothetical protein WMF38_56925 [Sorangium sp. So ce118]